VGLQLGVSIQYFGFMIWRCVIQYDVANHHEELFTPAGESAGQGALACHVDKPLPHPEPKLFLSGPKLVVISANNPRGLFYFHGKPFREMYLPPRRAIGSMADVTCD